MQCHRSQSTADNDSGKYLHQKRYELLKHFCKTRNERLEFERYTLFDPVVPFLGIYSKEIFANVQKYAQNHCW
jgi:hypothetical protein